jgi:predicted ATP-grasp superfamily ATP-dependent carboligase
MVISFVKECGANPALHDTAQTNHEQNRIAMHVFVYEHLSASADSSLPASLRVEGEAIRAAVTADLAQVSASDVRTLIGTQEESAFRDLARWADWSLVIAPEFDRLLETRCRWVEEEGGRLLGPSSQAVAQTADKLAVAAHLQTRGIRTPSCVPVASAAAFGYPIVCKPRYGAGSRATFLVRDDCALEHTRREAGAHELIAQPFVPGLAASVAFLIGPHQLMPLAPAAQHLSNDGRFRYQGGTVPLAADLASRAIHVARPAVESVPGLLGYVGLDVVLGEADDGSSDWVIEINPRLTTSYLGLRAFAETNLAATILNIMQGKEAQDPRWRSEDRLRLSVRWEC